MEGKSQDDYLPTTNDYSRQAPFIGKYITIFYDVLRTFTKVLGMKILIHIDSDF